MSGRGSNAADRWLDAHRSSAPPRAAGAPRVRLKRDGWVGRLPCYLAHVDGVLVGAVVGIEPAPGNPTRATAWRVQPTGRKPVVEDRLADARRWLHAHADELLAGEAERARARES